MKYGIAAALVVATAAGIGAFFYMQTAEADKADANNTPPVDDPIVDVNI